MLASFRTMDLLLNIYLWINILYVVSYLVVAISQRYCRARAQLRRRSFIYFFSYSLHSSSKDSSMMWRDRERTGQSHTHKSKSSVRTEWMIFEVAIFLRLFLRSTTALRLAAKHQCGGLRRCRIIWTEMMGRKIGVYCKIIKNFQRESQESFFMFWSVCVRCEVAYISALLFSSVFSHPSDE